MKKHFLNVLLLLALVATTGMLITSCKDYDDDINQLNDRIDQFEKDKIGSVEEQVAAIKSSITSLEAAYKAADTELKKELENQVSALNEAKKELEASIKSQIESQKNSHDADIEDLITKLNDLDKKVVENHESLSLEINKVAGNLATTKSALETIDEAVKALQSNGATKDEIKKLTEDLNALSTKVEEYNKSLSAEIKKVADELATTKSALETIDEAVKALQSNSATKDDIVKLTNELSALATKVEGYNTSLAAEIEKVKKNLADNYLTKTDVNDLLKNNKTEIEKELAELKTELTNLITDKIAELNGTIQGQIKELATKEEVKTLQDEFKKEIDGLDLDNRLNALDDKIENLKEEFNATIREKLAALESKFDGEIAGLNSRIGQCEGAIIAIDAQIKTMQGLIDGKVDQSDFDALNELVKTIQGDVKTIQEQLKTMEGQIANKANQSDLDELSAKHSALSAKHDALSGLVNTMQEQLNTMQEQIAGKVDKSEYEIFTQVTNNAIQRNARDIALLAGMCEDFGVQIKGHIDEAIKGVTETLSAFKEEYDAFIKEYGTFKTDIEGRVATAEGKITTLEAWKDEMTKDGGTLELLEKKLQEAIDEKTTLDEVKAEFNKNCTEFLNGVNDIITEALKNEGLIDKELKTRLNGLKDELMCEIEKLGKRVDDLDTRLNGVDELLGETNEKVDALVGQIQSLVYVPEFADGTTEMRSYSFGENTVNVPVKLTFRVSPAKMAKEMEKLFKAGALTLVTEEVKTRADAAPIAQIIDVKVLNEAAGTFTVETEIENYPADANKAVAVALAVNANIGETGVANDVVSNFGGVVKAETVELEFALFDAEGKYEGANIEIPWNTKKADSKREILKDLKLKVSLDKGENYMTLEEASNEIGTDIVADKYTTTSDPEKTDENFEIFNVEDEDWGSENHPWVQFTKANGTSELVGETVEFTYTIKAKLGENEAADAVNGIVTYTVIKDRIVNEFEKLTLPWTYEFVKNGIGAKDGADTPTPKVEFDEIALTNLPESVDLAAVLAETPEIKVNGEDAPEAGFTFAAGEKKGIKVAVEMDKYEWGKTYDIVYTYKKDETEYIFSGQIEFGPAPTDVNYKKKFTVGYEDKTHIDGFWKDVYDAWTAEGHADYFTGNTQFAEAIFAGTQSPSLTKGTKLINAENADPGKTIEETNGTKITANGGELKGELKKADITAGGDKFVQTATWTTWYGQEIKVTITYNVDLSGYTLKASDAWVKDGVVATKGVVDEIDEKWAVKLQGAIKDYFSHSPESEDVKEMYRKKSVDKPGEKYAEVIEGEEPQVTWENPTTTEDELEMTVELVLGENTVAASEDFTIKADDPIKTFKQNEADATFQYIPEKGKISEINLLKLITMEDINGGTWIENGTPRKTPKNQYTAKTVFNMKKGNDMEADDITAGIEFGTPENDDDLTFKVAGNMLQYEGDGSQLQKDVEVRIPATIKYWLGPKEGKTIILKVVLKK